MNVASVTPTVCRIDPGSALVERVIASGLRRSFRLSVKPFLRSSCPLGMQRGLVHVLSCLMQPESGVRVTRRTIEGPIGEIPVERIVPRDLPQPRHAVLYLHGGGFYLGSPRSYRSITTRLAHLAQAEVLAPHYRRAPEHAFPTQIKDCIAAYESLLAEGYAPERIAVAGDSAGGLLSLQLLLALRGRQGLPAVVGLISPLADPTFAGSGSLIERARRDPVVRVSWAKHTVAWLDPPPGDPLAEPLKQDLRGLPPMLVQVGEDEVLYDDAIQVCNLSARAGNYVELDVHSDRWHVFQIHAGLLRSATGALQRQADFMRRHWAS